ncbi:hypothetical protein MRB53_033601 [Persea americana]|uniref:Uncharacterized protein n=1 Tax=Persea americana TaxID=3435 RepID=A0ACC2KW21_PERAE|nr:hypothetical protein MRB53_033601 [Persea americana]
MEWKTNRLNGDGKSYFVLLSGKAASVWAVKVGKVAGSLGEWMDGIFCRQRHVLVISLPVRLVNIPRIRTHACCFAVGFVDDNDSG